MSTKCTVLVFQILHGHKRVIILTKISFPPDPQRAAYLWAIHVSHLFYCHTALCLHIRLSAVKGKSRTQNSSFSLIIVSWFSFLFFLLLTSQHFYVSAKEMPVLTAAAVLQVTVNDATWNTIIVNNIRFCQSMSSVFMLRTQILLWPALKLCSQETYNCWSCRIQRGF